MYFKGSQVEFSKLGFISVPEECFNICKQQTLMKCSIKECSGSIDGVLDSGSKGPHSRV